MADVIDALERGLREPPHRDDPAPGGKAPRERQPRFHLGMQFLCCQLAGFGTPGGAMGPLMGGDLVENAEGTPNSHRAWMDYLVQHMNDVLDAWSPRDREQLARLLGRFVDDLQGVRYRPPGNGRTA